MSNISSSTYDINVLGGKSIVTRNIAFRNGDTISFKVTLDATSSKTLTQLHHESAQAAIAYLEDWLKPE